VEDGGALRDIVVLAYREAYGGEIRDKRFLRQYRGKTMAAPMLPYQDIINIAGATMSVQATGSRRAQGRRGPARGRGPPGMSAATSGRPPLSTQVRPRMGTFLALTAPAGGRRGARAERIFAAAARWERVMSRYDPHSPVSAVNRAAGAAGVVSPDLARALRRARALARGTGGCFDPTVGPLVDLWNRAGRRGSAPAARAIAAARARSGWGSLRRAR
jgi:hypothetical protein